MEPERKSIGSFMSVFFAEKRLQMFRLWQNQFHTSTSSIVACRVVFLLYIILFNEYTSRFTELYLQQEKEEINAN